jgi:serine peptidase DegS
MSGLIAAAKFILKWTVVGLAVAFIIVVFKREWQIPAPLTPAAAPTRASITPMSFADAVALTAPAVVNIFTYRVVTEEVTPGSSPDGTKPATPAMRQGLETGLGSGVIVDTAGHVVTNNHVITCAERIFVQLADGRIDEARIVGTDPATDLAVLQISLKDLPTAVLGRSDDLRTGDIVLAIGTPFGLSQTVTQGIVSALGRGQLNVTAIEGFIQTDAAVNDGNSGGALIDSQGQLIGINTAALSRNLGVNGISFAIPVDLVRGVMSSIVRFGRVKRGWFGVETAGLTAQQAAILGPQASEGIVITNVSPSSPAAEAGLRPGDLIIGINGARRSLGEALSVVASTPPGERIALSVVRQNTRYDFTVTLVERTAQEDERAVCSAPSKK